VGDNPPQQRAHVRGPRPPQSQDILAMQRGCSVFTWIDREPETTTVAGHSGYPTRLQRVHMDRQRARDHRSRRPFWLSNEAAACSRGKTATHDHRSHSTFWQSNEDAARSLDRQRPKAAEPCKSFPGPAYSRGTQELLVMLQAERRQTKIGTAFVCDISHLGVSVMKGLEEWSDGQGGMQT
jgi:hypothetical protein